MTVGRHSYGFEGAVIMPENDDQVLVGNYCSCAGDVRLIVSGYHHQGVSTFPLRTILEGVAEWPDKSMKGQIVIEHDVWLCTRAVILSGVTIGIGSIVGAGAVVHDSCPPYSLVAGNPARVVRRRFSQTTIHRLLALAWWEWPDEKVRDHLADFYGPVEEFLAKHGG